MNLCKKHEQIEDAVRAANPAEAAGENHCSGMPSGVPEHLVSAEVDVALQNGCRLCAAARRLWSQLRVAHAADQLLGNGPAHGIRRPV